MIPETATPSTSERRVRPALLSPRAHAGKRSALAAACAAISAAVFALGFPVSARADAQRAAHDLLAYAHSEWVLELEKVERSAAPPERLTDVVNFDKGMFFSRRLGTEGYLAAQAEFRLIKTDGVGWDAMQVKGDTGVALWTGEVRGGRVEGTVHQYSMRGPPQSVMYSFIGHRLTEETLDDLSAPGQPTGDLRQDGPSWNDTVSLLKERLLALVMLQNRLVAMERRQLQLEEQNRALAAAVIERQALESAGSALKMAPAPGKVHVAPEIHVDAPPAHKAEPLAEHYEEVFKAEEATRELRAIEDRLKALYGVHEDLVQGFSKLERELAEARGGGTGPLAMLREQEATVAVEPLSVEQLQAMERLRDELSTQLGAQSELKRQVDHIRGVMDSRQDTINDLQREILRLRHQLETNPENARLRVLLARKQEALDALMAAHERVLVLLQRLRVILETLKSMQQKQVMQD